MNTNFGNNTNTKSKTIMQCAIAKNSMHSPKNKNLISAYRPSKKIRGKQLKLKTFKKAAQNKKLMILRKKVDGSSNKPRPVVSFQKEDFCRKSEKQIFGKVKQKMIFRKLNKENDGKGLNTKQSVNLRKSKFKPHLYQKTLQKDFPLIFKQNLDLQSRLDFLESQNQRMKVQEKSKDQQILCLEWKVEQLKKEVCFLRQKLIMDQGKTNRVFLKQKVDCKVPNNSMKRKLPFYLPKNKILKKATLGKISEAKANANVNIHKKGQQLKGTSNLTKLPKFYVNKIRKLNKQQTKHKENNNYVISNRNTQTKLFYKANNKSLFERKTNQALLNKENTTDTINIYEINNRTRRNSFEQFAKKTLQNKDAFNLSGTDDFNEFDFEYKSPMAIIKKVFRVPSQKNKLRLRNKLAMIHKAKRLNPKVKIKQMESKEKRCSIFQINTEKFNKKKESKQNTEDDPNMHCQETLYSWSNTKKGSTFSGYTKTTKISSVNHKRNKLGTCNPLPKSRKNSGLFDYSKSRGKQLNSDYFNDASSGSSTSQLDIWNSRKKLDTGNPIKIINGMNLFLEEHRSIDRNRRQTMGYLTNTLKLNNQNLLKKSSDDMEEVYKKTRPGESKTSSNQYESGASRSDKNMCSNGFGSKESNHIMGKSGEMGLSEEIFSAFETLVNRPVLKMRKSPRKAIKRGLKYQQDAIQV